MKILNVFDTAGVGAIFGKYHDGITTLQTTQLDKFHIDSYYTNTIIYPDSNKLLDDAKQVQDNYDHIVIHDQTVALEQFSRHPSVTMFHHGGVLRGSGGECEDRKAHRVFVSTPDLMHWRQTAIHIPAPIDTDLFWNNGTGNGGLMINRERNKEIIEKCVANRIGGVIYRVRDNQYITYENMPNLLRQYNFYVDTKWDYSHPPKLIHNALSTTALQALACGLIVYDSEFLSNVGLPKQNRGHNATEYFIKALNNDI